MYNYTLLTFTTMQRRYTLEYDRECYSYDSLLVFGIQKEQKKDPECEL